MQHSAAIGLLIVLFPVLSTGSKAAPNAFVILIIAAPGGF